MANEKKGSSNGNKSKSPYHETADLLNKVLESNKNKNLKSFVYAKDGSLKVSTKTYAVVTKVLQHLTELQDCQAAVADKLQVKNQGLLLVLLYELLLSPKQSIQGGGALKRQLMQHETSLRRALKKSAKKTETDANSRDHSTSNFPRYLRVNTCRTTTKKVIQYIKKDLQISSVYADSHVPDLLVVPHAATSQILASNLAKQHHVILQDKSSCFSALCLLHDDDNNKTTANEHGDILDACAAPGNKTSHLAALLMKKEQQQAKDGKKRTIYALDRDNDRCKLLKERMQQLVPSEDEAPNLQVEHKDFLKTQPANYASVTSILLDPSCSGSGIYTRQQQEKGDDENRLQKLSNFQFTCLKHAMSFENVERIVYSTCSIHSQENEFVVAACLSNKDNGDWEIVAPACLATWKRRGVEYAAPAEDNSVRSLTKDETSKLIRVNHEDDTNGFFVCCLQRKAAIVQKKKKTFRNPNLDLGIPIYNGEFSNDSQISSSSQRETVSNNVESDLVDSKKSSKVSEPKAKKKRKQRAEDDDNKDEKDEEQSAPMNKKRAKKLEWKRRQREQKRSRLGAKSGFPK